MLPQITSGRIHEGHCPWTWITTTTTTILSPLSLFFSSSSFRPSFLLLLPSFLLLLLLLLPSSSSSSSCPRSEITMEETANQSFHDLGFKGIDANGTQQHNQWLIMGGSADDNSDTISMESSSFQDSENSIESSSSLDLTEDASSSPSSSTSPLSNGPLYELSELMAHLPIKRGLSKYFQGKSQSFTSLASVKSLEDLAKKGIPSRKKMKSCKSYGGGLDAHKLYTPKATISKKASRGSLLLSSLGRGGVIMGTTCRPPNPIPLHKNF